MSREKDKQIDRYGDMPCFTPNQREEKGSTRVFIPSSSEPKRRLDC